ncbi:MAG: hypothetical protein WCH99_12385 [Verrucomicrobiota bacterium]
MSLTLTNTKGGDFTPHPEGYHGAVCIDVMDCGMMETSFQGVKKMVHKLKLVFESEAVTEKGVRCTIQKVLTASLAPKANLAKLLGTWRGRPIAEGEKIDLNKLIGTSCAILVSHQKSPDGTKIYANIDAITKPIKVVIPSGTYDPVAARQRFADWKAKNGLPPMPTPQPATAAAPADNGEGSDLGPVAAAPVAPAPAPAAPPPYRPLPVNAAGPVIPPVAAPVPAPAPAPAPAAAVAPVAAAAPGLPEDAGDIDVPF